MHLAILWLLCCATVIDVDYLICFCTVSFVCQGEYLFSFLNFIAEEIEMPSVL